VGPQKGAHSMTRIRYITPEIRRTRGACGFCLRDGTDVTPHIKRLRLTGLHRIGTELAERHRQEILLWRIDGGQRDVVHVFTPMNKEPT